jgi:hypothetical protein
MSFNINFIRFSYILIKYYLLFLKKLKEKIIYYIRIFKLIDG